MTMHWAETGPERAQDFFRYTVRCDRLRAMAIKRAAKKTGVSETQFVQDHFDRILNAGSPSAPKAAPQGSSAERRLAESVAMPPEWRLSPRFERMVRALLAHERVTHEELMTALFAVPLHFDDAAYKRALSELRCNLKPFGFTITNLMGFGYRLEQREAWLAALAAGRSTLVEGVD